LLNVLSIIIMANVMAAQSVIAITVMRHALDIGLIKIVVVALDTLVIPAQNPRMPIAMLAVIVMTVNAVISKLERKEGIGTLKRRGNTNLDRKSNFLS